MCWVKIIYRYLRTHVYVCVFVCVFENTLRAPSSWLIAGQATNTTNYYFKNAFSHQQKARHTLFSLKAATEQTTRQATNIVLVVV